MILHDDSDTICAIATANGSGGVAIIRISGLNALATANKIFDNRFFLENPKPRYAYFGNFVSRLTGSAGSAGSDRCEVLDSGILLYFQSPHSYTGEDIIELHIHGGFLNSHNILRHILETTDIRLAQAGEFTKRAFLNGKIHLSQAEAIGDIISAESSAALIAARNRMTGDFHKKLDHLQDRLIEIAAILSTAIDFPDENIVFPQTNHILEIIDQGLHITSQLIQSYHQGKLIQNGVSVAIVGKPNVGKSSLFNAMLGEERAIVHETAGTTRDTISESFQLNKVRFILHDTAGIRNTEDVIESAGVALSKKKLLECHIILLVIDGSKPFDREDTLLDSLIGKQNIFVIINKTDLPSAFSITDNFSRLGVNSQNIYHVSSITKQGIDKLSQGLLSFCSLDDTSLSLSQTIITSERHYHSLIKTKESLLHAKASLLQSEHPELVMPELVMVDLNDAIDSLGEITGKNISEDILDRIFEKFCIGK